MYRSKGITLANQSWQLKVLALLLLNPEFFQPAAMDPGNWEHIFPFSFWLFKKKTTFM
jgi:hypothetical protein